MIEEIKTPRTHSQYLSSLDDLIQLIRQYIRSEPRLGQNHNDIKANFNKELQKILDEGTREESDEKTEGIICVAMKHFRDLVTEYLNENCKIDDSDGDILVGFLENYRKFLKQLRSMKWIFKYLDQIFLDEKNIIWKVGINRFIIHIFQPHQQNLYDRICKICTQHPQSFDDQLTQQVKGFCNALVEMRDNEENQKFFVQFETQILEATEEANQQIYHELIQSTNGTFAYLTNLKTLEQKSSSFLEDAFQNCKTLKDQLLKQFRNIFINQYKPILLDPQNNQGLTSMLAQPDNKEYHSYLQIVAQLYDKLQDRFDQIRQTMKEFIQQKGRLIVAVKYEQIIQSNVPYLVVNSKDQFIQQLFELHNTYQQLIEICFGDNQFIRQSLKDAFENFINENLGDYGIAEYLALYVAERFNIKQDKEYLTNIQQIFSYIGHKDQFLIIYQQKLAERILFKKAELSDENNMITKLNEISGSQSVKHIEEMLKELQLQKFEFIESLVKELKMDIDLRVFSSTSWPEFIEFTDNPLCDSISIAQEKIDKELSKHKLYDRRLIKWSNSLSQVIVKYKKYDLHMTVNMASILFVFQYKNDPQTLSELLWQTKLSKQYLEDNVNALVKLNLLILEGGGYKFNDGFTSKKLKVDGIPLLIPFKEIEKKQLENEREVAVEAAIAKIMKKHKTLNIMELFMEVQHYLKSFHPTTKQIKEQLEKLFRLEYLKRDSEKQDVIYYVN